MKKAFTLIELLVVIAIIAILAAILFPVFAQAKSAAKGAASLSNDKQEALAVLMYTNDSDDVAVLDTGWGGGYPVWYGFAGSDFAPWTYLIQPYTKNVGILADPLAAALAPVPAGWPANLWLAYEGTEYGYDYTVFSPVFFGNKDKNGNLNRFPISMTSPARPAEVVLLTAHTAPSEPGDNWWYGVGTINTLYGADPVDCADVAPACFTNWGNGGFFQTNAGMKDYTTGAITGFNAPRRADHLVTTFADGHAKAAATNSLGVGTNYTPVINVNAIKILNPLVYAWTIQ